MCEFVIIPWLGALNALATGAMILWLAAILVLIAKQIKNKNDDEKESVSTETPDKGKE